MLQNCEITLISCKISCADNSRNIGAMVTFVTPKKEQRHIFSSECVRIESPQKPLYAAVTKNKEKSIAHMTKKPHKPILGKCGYNYDCL